MQRRDVLVQLRRSNQFEFSEYAEEHQNGTLKFVRKVIAEKGAMHFYFNVSLICTQCSSSTCIQGSGAEQTVCGLDGRIVTQQRINNCPCAKTSSARRHASWEALQSKPYMVWVWETWHITYVGVHITFTDDFWCADERLATWQVPLSPRWRSSHLLSLMHACLSHANARARARLSLSLCH